VALAVAVAEEVADRGIQFALKDQFNQDLVLEPPFTGPVLVTVADRSGADELDGWIQPLKESFPGRIRYVAVADLRSVPAPMRGLVRRGFRKQYAHPIGLDWNGDLARQTSLEKEHLNLLLLGPRGEPRLRLTGTVTEAGLNRLKSGIRALLPDPPVSDREPLKEQDPP